MVRRAKKGLTRAHVIVGVCFIVLVADPVPADKIANLDIFHDAHVAPYATQTYRPEGLEVLAWHGGTIRLSLYSRSSFKSL